MMYQAKEEKTAVSAFTRALGCALFLLAMVALPQSAAAFDDGAGREWRPLTETVGPSWAAVAAICPQDGATPCNGSIGTVNYTGWVWATQSQLRSVFTRYSGSMATLNRVDNTGAGSAMIAEFAATEFGSPPCQNYACAPSIYSFSFGVTASKDVAGNVTTGSGNWFSDYFAGTGDSLIIGAGADSASASRGVFLWRPTGAGTGLVVANDDQGTTATEAGGQIVANVLANDRNNGALATGSNVTLSVVSSSKPGLTLNTATGAVNADASVGVGIHTLTYRICSTTNTNCDDAVVTAWVAYKAISANPELGGVTNSVGGVAFPNVLTNDTLGNTGATLASVALTQVSVSNASLSLNTATGAVNAAAGMAAGSYTLVYQICERAVPTNCSQATVTVNVRQGTLIANADSGGASGATGGVAIANVAANDTLDGVPVNIGNVTLTQVSSTSAGISLNAATGAVSVAKGTASATYTLTYRICVRAVPTNCAQANATITVRENVIDAVNDTARGSSKVANTPIPNVLANDTLNGAPATTATVTISVLGALPSGFTFNTATGAISVAAKTTSGSYTINYRICEIASPANCDNATATVDLSGKG
jgi:hypothetical protein